MSQFFQNREVFAVTSYQVLKYVPLNTSSISNHFLIIRCPYLVSIQLYLEKKIEGRNNDNSEW